MCFLRQSAVRSTNNLKISCWNVNGLGKNSVLGHKLHNSDFLNQFNSSDIFIMSEIWVSDVNELPGFDIIALSPPRKLNTKRSGRFSGGILVAVKRFLTPHFSLIKQTSEYIWLKIDKNILQLDKDILLCSCYIPPKHSPYFNPDTLLNLENDINLFKRNSYIVLAGDFNARTGVEIDFISNENCEFVPGGGSPLPNVVAPRKSFDNNVNDLGKHLLEMCKSLDLRILNGRCKGDSLGKITFHGNQGFSTVDYIIVSHEILHLFESFVVREPSPFSDHCQLLSRIKIDSCLLNNNDNSCEGELFSLPRQFKWTKDSKDSFTAALQSDKIKQLIRDFELLNCDRIGDVNEIVNKFMNILETAAKHSLPLVKVNRNSRKRHSQFWFDNECNNVRKRLSRLSHKTHKNPFDEQTRREYLPARRQYKQLLRHKKLKYRENKMMNLLTLDTQLSFGPI